MKVVCRTDASHTIGHGHVIRCLTLAAELRDRGATVSFICREHDGNLCDLIEDRGFAVRRLPVSGSEEVDAGTVHGAWLGDSVASDVRQSTAAIASSRGRVDWLVVDHYSLDVRWESAMRAAAARMMVIDDLADRRHDCNLLLDQNLVRNMSTRYAGKVPVMCDVMLGPEYALLQPIYAELHARMSPRTGPVTRLFIFFGAADRENLTGRAIAAFQRLQRPDVQVDVVISSGSRHESSLRRQIAGHPNIHMNVGLPSLAPLLAEADLAIGAGGATAWERLCLGVPTLVVTLAENQRPVTENLHALGLVQWLGHQDAVDETQFSGALTRALEMTSLAEWSDRCLRACSGRGVFLVADRMAQSPHNPSRHHSGALPLAAES